LRAILADALRADAVTRRDVHGLVAVRPDLLIRAANALDALEAELARKNKAGGMLASVLMATLYSPSGFTGPPVWWDNQARTAISMWEAALSAVQENEISAEQRLNEVVRFAQAESVEQIQTRLASLIRRLEPHATTSDVARFVRHEYLDGVLRRALPAAQEDETR
jgi:hypothetical protein